MRTTLILLLLLPLPALAHVGHLEEFEWHSHYIAAWALLGVIVGSCWLIWAEMQAPQGKAKRSKDGGAGA